MSSPMTVHQLDDRLTVVCDTDPRLRTTTWCLRTGFGARHDPVGKGGIAHLLEHLLMSVPVDGGPGLSERVEATGGSCNAMTGPDFLLVHARTRSEDAHRVLGWLAEAAVAPDLTKDRLDAEREVVLRELATAAADPSDAVREAVYTELFPEHPLGRVVGGTPEELAGVTVADVLDTHAERFLASRHLLICVGPQAMDEILPAVRATPLGALPPARTAPDGPRVAPSLPVVRRDRPAWPRDEFCWLVLCARAAPRDSELRAAEKVLAQLMGGSPASLAYQRLRNERGLAYLFHAQQRGYAESGVWYMIVGVEAERGPATLEVARELLAELAGRGPGEAALDAARTQAGMSLVFAAEQPQDRVLQLAAHVAPTGEGPPWSLERELELLHQVTARDVRDAAARMLDGLHVIVRPEAS
ncbi:insulinase family protein [Streptomyces sp. PTM05]|uniref:Insulinase family protein n=1 Tax=Streptantibioticus parmotrematis TaxID=2873249 RepID=A0ABS7QWF1_9ACTN|nr:pitrilysin family protein [Streptantibioticus parmotrematis]MBY8887532.1 insulinase family protein [Streptantibioticus parmotrematis]